MKDPKRYRYKRPNRARYRLILLLFTLLFLVLICRLFDIQIRQHEKFRVIADEGKKALIKLPAARGLIFDCTGRELAVNVPRYSIYAIPRAIENAEAVSERLASILELDYGTVKSAVSGDGMFRWILRKVDDESAEAVRSAGFKGVGFLLENERCYPSGSLGAHILGFVDIDNCGLEGIERYYDDELKGYQGQRIILVDAKRRQVDSPPDGFTPPKDGLNLVLTLDETIQHIAEQALAKAVRKHNPRSVSIVVMKPDNGEILALCNYPAFDPNNISQAGAGARRNRALTDVFEPGSSFKIVTAAAALEDRVFKIGDIFHCEDGEYRIGGRILHDHKPYKDLDFCQVIEKSSNIGTVKIAQALGPERLSSYIDSFGFGEVTGIDLPGEVGGIVHDPSDWTGGSIAAIPIGQEIAVTAVQLAQAVSCIANGGMRMRPHLLKRITDAAGATIREVKPRMVRRVISKSTASALKDILVRVVEEGTGKRAGCENYITAGKTGTGQRLEDDGTYSHKKYNSVFIGFAPAHEPRIAVSVVVIEPHLQYYGGTVAAPVFSEIVDEGLRYLGITPDRS